MVDPLSYFSIQPVLHSKTASILNWCNKGCGMYYPVLMVHIKDPLMLIGKSSPCSGSSRFPVSLSVWSFTICLTPYNCNLQRLDNQANLTNFVFSDEKSQLPAGEVNTGGYPYPSDPGVMPQVPPYPMDPNMRQPAPPPDGYGK